jgi:hypothetical protein
MRPARSPWVGYRSVDVIVKQRSSSPCSRCEVLIDKRSPTLGDDAKTGDATLLFEADTSGASPITFQSLQCSVEQEIRLW